jgi:hypothetical protein
MAAPTGGGNCSPDEAQIQRHFQSSIVWSGIPFVGPSLTKYATPLPADGQEDLDTAKGTLLANTSDWQAKVTTLTVANTTNLNELLKLIPPYTEAAATLIVLPVSQDVQILYIQVISIMIIMMIIIFYGIHK